MNCFDYDDVLQAQCEFLPKEFHNWFRREINNYRSGGFKKKAMEAVLLRCALEDCFNALSKKV